MQHLQFRTSGHVHLGAGRADVFDQADHPVHFRVCIFVNQISGLVGRPVGVNQWLFAGAGGLPQLFGDERHDRVQHDQALVQNPAHDGLSLGLGVRVLAHQEWLRELDIPVADLAPDKGVQGIGSVVETEGFKGGIDLFADAGDLTNDPFIQRMTCI